MRLRDRHRTLGARDAPEGRAARPGGHFAIWSVKGFCGCSEFHAALDAEKDQSYCLFELTQGQLAAALFSLGEMTKPQVRHLARD